MHYVATNTTYGQVGFCLNSLGEYQVYLVAFPVRIGQSSLLQPSILAMIFGLWHTRSGSGASPHCLKIPLLMEDVYGPVHLGQCQLLLADIVAPCLKSLVNCLLGLLCPDTGQPASATPVWAPGFSRMPIKLTREFFQLTSSKFTSCIIQILPF